MTRHPSPDELACLVDGALAEEDAERVRQHLAGCPECYGAFAHAAGHKAAMLRREGQWPVQDPELRRIAEHIGGAPASQARPERSAGPRVGTRRFVWALAAVAVIVLAMMVFRQKPSPVSDPLLATAVPTEVQDAVVAVSAFGMMLPGGDTARASDPERYRAGQAGPDSALDVAMASLATESRNDDALVEHAVWLGSGYLAQGQLQTAKSHVRASKQRFGDDSRLLTLEGTIAYRESRLEDAERLFRQAIDTEPEAGRPVAMLNLAIVLRETGVDDEAEPYLRDLADSDSEILRERARALLNRQSPKR